MASPYSKPIEYTPYRNLFDKELLVNALAYRQEKFDFNKAKIDNLVQTAVNLDLAKIGDKEYFSARLESIEDAINRFGTGDLSLDSRSDYLASYISQAMDEKVFNGYAGTLARNNIMAGAAKAKEDGTFTQGNLNFSLKENDAWLNDGKVGSQYTGGSSYIPYYDYLKLMNEAAEKIDGIAYVELSDVGNFTFFKTDGNEVTDDAVKNRLMATVLNDPRAQSQIRIDAWNQYQGMDDEEFFTLIKDRNQDLVEDLNNLINAQKKELLIINDPNAKNQMQAQIDLYEAQRNKIVSDFGEAFGFQSQNASTLEKDLKERIANSTGSNKAYYEQQLAMLEANQQQVATGAAAQQNTFKPGQRAAYEYQMFANDLLNDYADAFAYKSIDDVGFITNDGALRMSIHNDEMKRRDQEIANAQRAESFKELQEVIKTYYDNPEEAEALFNSYIAANGPNAFGAAFGSDFDFYRKQYLDKADYYLEDITAAEFANTGYADLILKTNGAIYEYQDLTEELVIFFHDLEGLNSSLNPTDHPELYFTEERAEQLEQAGWGEDLAGTPNWMELTQQVLNETGLFSEEGRKAFKMDESEFVTFQKQLKAANTQVGSFRALADEASEMVNETVGVALDELTNSNNYFLTPDAGIVTSVGVVFYDNDRGQYYFQANPLTGRNEEDYDPNQWLILSMNSEEGETIYDRKYFGNKEQAMMFLAQEQSKSGGYIQGSTSFFDGVDSTKIDIDYLAPYNEVMRNFYDSYGDIMKTPSLDVKSNSPASMEAMAQVISAASAQDAFGEDNEIMKSYGDFAVIKAAIEATNKLSGADDEDMGDLGVRNARISTDVAGNVVLQGEFFDAEEGEFVDASVSLNMNTLGPSTIAYQELKPIFDNAQNLMKNEMYANSVFSNMSDNSSLDEKVTFVASEIVTDAGETVTVNVTSGAQFLKSDIRGERVRPFVTFTVVAEDGTEYSHQFRRVIDRYELPDKLGYSEALEIIDLESMTLDVNNALFNEDVFLDYYNETIEKGK